MLMALTPDVIVMDSHLRGSSYFLCHSGHLPSGILLKGRYINFCNTLVLITHLPISRRSYEKRSPVHHAVDRAVAERTVSGHKVSESRRLPIFSRSPERDSRNQNDVHDREHGATSDECPNLSESPSHLRRIGPRENRSHVSNNSCGVNI